MRTAFVMIAVLLSGCGDRGTDEPSDASAPSASSALPPARQGPRWELTSEGGATALVFGAQRIQLICPRGADQLLVNIPAFRPIGSEERLSFGSGGEVVALVAATSGDAQRGGVTGAGPVPPDLAKLIAGPIAASYGAQQSGPHPAPPAALAEAFVAACRGEPVQPPPKPVQTAGACRTQDGQTIPANRLHAIGTEPFWAADIEGRCVTYSTPENQAGTRVWTRFGGTAEQGSWTGFLDNQRFVMRTRPQPGCSDGMSDNRYPIAVTLTVKGEERRGCAEPR